METIENLLKEHDIEIPKEIKELIVELDSIKSFDEQGDLHQIDDDYDPYN